MEDKNRPYKAFHERSLNEVIALQVESLRATREGGQNLSPFDFVSQVVGLTNSMAVSPENIAYLTSLMEPNLNLNSPSSPQQEHTQQNEQQEEQAKLSDLSPPAPSTPPSEFDSDSTTRTESSSPVFTTTTTTTTTSTTPSTSTPAVPSSPPSDSNTHIPEQPTPAKKKGRPPGVKPYECSQCHKRETPEWRKGFQGQPLCNACGLKFIKKNKQEKKSKDRHSLGNILNHEEEEEEDDDDDKTNNNNYSRKSSSSDKKKKKKK